MGQDRSKISLLMDTGLTKNITILPELEALIRPLGDEEFEQLEANIVDQGCRDSLMIWKTEKGVINNSDDSTVLNILVDGHNRYKICLKNNIDYEVTLGKFSSLDQVKDWMILNQLGRRNITPEEQSYLRGKLYNARKEHKGRYDRLPADQIAQLPVNILLDKAPDDQMPEKPLPNPVSSDTSKDMPVKKGKSSTGKDKKNTALELAEQFQVGERTIRNDGEFASGLDKLSNSLRNQVLGRKTKVFKADLIKLADLPDLEKPIETVTELKKYISVEESSALPVNTNSSNAVPAAERLGGNTTKNKQGRHSYTNQVKTILKMVEGLQNREIPDKTTCDEILSVVDELRKNLTSLKSKLPWL